MTAIATTQEKTPNAAWHCVADSADLLPGRLLAVQADGVDLVLWRALTADGLALRAWEDVCPHRGAKLSRGLIRDGQLLCYKHAWRFDVDGVRLTTLPESGTTKPDNDFNNVLLPTPLGPTIPQHWLGSTEKLTLSRSIRGPKLTLSNSVRRELATQRLYAKWVRETE